MKLHIVQSPEWGQFKTEYGTKAARVDSLQYTVHKIPFTSFAVAYSPKVSLDQLKVADWTKLKKSLHSDNCVSLNFDVPDVEKGSEEEKEVLDLLDSMETIKAPRNQFAKWNVLLDITKPEQELLANMHPKHRYNIGLAQKKGMHITHGKTIEDFLIFYSLLHETAIREKYYIHPRGYYQKIWELLQPKNIAHIITASSNGTPLCSWMLFTYNSVLYYPYGGSSITQRNLFASNLVAWEAIKLGKEHNCGTFDMWGASKDPNDQTDPWWGFTNFKLKFGGRHVEYMDSYDLVLNPYVYIMFNTVNNLRWKILKALK